MVTSMILAAFTTENLVKLCIVIIIVAVTIVLDKLLRRAVSRYGKRADLDPH